MADGIRVARFLTIGGVRHELAPDGVYHPVGPRPAQRERVKRQRREAANQGHTSMYWLYDDAGALLYVGIAGNPGRRFEQHRSDKSWWGQVSDIKLQHFASRSEAMSAVAEAIRMYRPPHNNSHTRART